MECYKVYTVHYATYITQEKVLGAPSTDSTEIYNCTVFLTVIGIYIS